MRMWTDYYGNTLNIVRLDGADRTPFAVHCQQREGTEDTPMSEIAERRYARPEGLGATGWVAQHPADPSVRIVESNEDPLLYPAGHIAGAVQIDWATDLNDPLRRDYLDRAHFAQLM